MRKKPVQSILPLFCDVIPNEKLEFLGTSFIVESGSWLVTANHVIHDCDSQILAFVDAGTKDARFIEVSVRVQEPNLDLALLSLEDFEPKDSLRIAGEDEFTGNLPVACYEYSLTHFQGNELHIDTASRLGNLVRIADFQQRYGEAGKYMLELSFPALKGASGAPVVQANTFGLLGIVIANVSHHLLPVQIESLLDEENEIYEEVQYLLPQAVAVNSLHLRKLIEEQD